LRGLKKDAPRFEEIEAELDSLGELRDKTWRYGPHQHI
jgi:hypothetical protein